MTVSFLRIEVQLIFALETIEFFEKRLNMVSGSLNKVGSQLQQKQMAKMAIGKEIESKMKNMQLYNKIYS